MESAVCGKGLRRLRDAELSVDACAQVQPSPKTISAGKNHPDRWHGLAGSLSGLKGYETDGIEHEECQVEYRCSGWKFLDIN